MTPFIACTILLSFFVLHWWTSVFMQTFFLHRYGAHRYFTMSKGWERFFYFTTWITQGASYLVPHAYAVLHREHHAFSDTDRDPHSPVRFPNFLTMMWHTKERYSGLVHNTIEFEPRFAANLPSWPALDRIADSWFTRIGFGALYTLPYLFLVPVIATASIPLAVAFSLLVPAHYLMGPIHGAIVNWCGHKYGYRNFAEGDASRNTLPIDFITLGELYQNNHHGRSDSPNFAVRWWEIDPSWTVIRTLAALGIIKMRGAAGRSSTSLGSGPASRSKHRKSSLESLVPTPE